MARLIWKWLRTMRVRVGPEAYTDPAEFYFVEQTSCENSPQEKETQINILQAAKKLQGTTIGIE